MSCYFCILIFNLIIIIIGETMNEMLNVIIRTFSMTIILFILTKFMGKKQISQLNFFDYIIGITIGSIVADIALDLEKNFLFGVICLFCFGLFSVLISYIVMNSITLRRFLVGVPTILIENNKVIEGGLKKSKLDINELLTEARSQGYFKLEDIEYAIMETNGKISFMPNSLQSPATKKDINAKVSKESLVANVIIDSKLLEENIKEMNKNKKWLDSVLKVQGYENYNNILLATLDINDKVVVYEKNIKSKKNSVLE